MRTTLNLEDDAVEMIRQYSEARSIALGKAASELVRKGFATPTPTRIVNGLVVFDLPPDSPLVTSEQVKKLLYEMDDAEAKRQGDEGLPFSR
jgi:hypothetical protein